MRESQYIDDYLDSCGRNPVTTGTYLSGVLRGRAKGWIGRYERSLINAIRRRLADGTIKQVRSVRGSVSYVRVPPGVDE